MYCIIYCIVGIIVYFFTYKKYYPILSSKIRTAQLANRNRERYEGMEATGILEYIEAWIMITIPLFWVITVPTIGIWIILEKLTGNNKLETKNNKNE